MRLLFALGLSNNHGKWIKITICDNNFIHTRSHWHISSYNKLLKNANRITGLTEQTKHMAFLGFHLKLLDILWIVMDMKCVCIKLKIGKQPAKCIAKWCNMHACCRRQYKRRDVHKLARKINEHRFSLQYGEKNTAKHKCEWASIKNQNIKITN